MEEPGTTRPGRRARPPLDQLMHRRERAVAPLGHRIAPPSNLALGPAGQNPLVVDALEVGLGGGGCGFERRSDLSALPEWIAHAASLFLRPRLHARSALRPSAHSARPVEPMTAGTP